MDFPDLPFLGTFVRVYETGSITTAARRLHRTQPTVSYQLQRLEEALGAPLFERRSARLFPTALADRLFRFLGGFARDVHSVLSGVEEDRPLEVAAVAGFGRYVLFPVVLESARLRKGLTLRFPTAEGIFQRVLEGQVDVGFSYQPTVHPRLTLEPVYEERLVLAAGPGWARRLREQSGFQDVPVVTYDEGDYVVGRWLGHHFGRRQPRWHSVAHFEELEEVLALVARDEGVAVVPDFCLGAGRRVHMVDWGKPALTNSIYAVLRARAPVRPAVTELLARLRELGSGRERTPLRRGLATVRRHSRPGKPRTRSPRG
jgi:LysR family cyn operon transcriptional activator